jgi:hypothetical protein
MSAHFYVIEIDFGDFGLRCSGKAPSRVSVKDTIKIGNSIGQFVRRVSKIDDADLIEDIP